jgi:DNA replication and repair protein RecF
MVFVIHYPKYFGNGRRVDFVRRRIALFRGKALQFVEKTGFPGHLGDRFSVNVVAAPPVGGKTARKQSTAPGSTRHLFRNLFPFGFASVRRILDCERSFRTSVGLHLPIGPMNLQTLHLKDFRIHALAEYTFGPRVNLICGPNGVGKTNLLEAIHYLALTKGFLVSSDQILLRKGASFFELKGVFSGERQHRIAVRAAFARNEGKKFFVNGGEVERKSSHVGRIPLVLLCPQDQALTAGPPAERRRFLDNIISQSSSTYLEDLMRYRRALRQRNEVLQGLRRSSPSAAGPLLDSWTNELVETGSRIVCTRSRFSTGFSGQLALAHERLREAVEQPRLQYVSFDGLEGGGISVEDARDAFVQALERRAQAERSRGITLAGPHRDNLKFSLDGLDVRQYASQGQHRTFGMALKLAQYQYLHEMTGEKPILLLDDVFDNLDGHRIGLILDLLQEPEMGQTVITAARRDILDRFLEYDTGRVDLIEMKTAGTESVDSDDTVHETAAGA